MHSLVNERVCPNQKNGSFLLDVRSVIRSAARQVFRFREFKKKRVTLAGLVRLQRKESACWRIRCV